LDRGYGRPQQNADGAMQHPFVYAPEEVPTLPPPDDDPERKLN
jgi:hypothetical protein